MTLMGTAFRAPRKTDLSQWRKVAALARHGFLFHRNAGSRPERLSEVAAFLEGQRQRRRSPGQVLLERLASQPPVTPARAQGRVRRINPSGRPTFTLAGRPLEPWDSVAVLVDGHWRRGTFRLGGYERQDPCVEIVDGTGSRSVRLTPNTVCRWLEPPL